MVHVTSSATISSAMTVAKSRSYESWLLCKCHSPFRARSLTLRIPRAALRLPWAELLCPFGADRRELARKIPGCQVFVAHLIENGQIDKVCDEVCDEVSERIAYTRLPAPIIRLTVGH